MSKNNVSIGGGSWFNKISQGDNNNGGSTYLIKELLLGHGLNAVSMSTN